MPKTVTYIDGQNFLYSVAANLEKAGLISNKQDLYSLDIPFLLEQSLFNGSEQDNAIDDIRYYGVSKIKQQTELGERMLQKSIAFSENLRKLKNCLMKTGVKYIPCGQLRPRGIDKCKNCGFEDYKFQEKGVDVGMAVDIVRDTMEGQSR